MRAAREWMPGRAAWSLILPSVVVLALGASCLIGFRGLGRYSPPDFGGPEPYENHRAALEILDHGSTTMVFHPPGYAYLVALTYSALPKVPLSTLFVQIALLPLLVVGVHRLAILLEAGPPALFAWGAALYLPFAYFACGFNSIFMTMLAVGAAAWAARPLLDRGSVARSAAVGLLVGAAGCLRPNFALVGGAMWLALWLATGQWRELVRRGLPMAVAALALFGTVNGVNRPVGGQSLRGSFGLWSGLLVATYQYEYQWWDWDWYFDESYRGFREYKAEIARIEGETGYPISDPRSEGELRRAAIARIVGKPLNTLKKALVSSVRIWVLVPTQLKAAAPRWIAGSLELALLGLALVGAAGLKRTPFFWLCIGIVAIPTLTHMVLHVEPRYALPGKPFELVFAGAGAWRVLGRRLLEPRQEWGGEG